MTEYSTIEVTFLKGSVVIYAFGFCVSVMAMVSSALATFSDLSNSYWIVLFAIPSILCLLAFREAAQKLSDIEYNKEVAND